MRKNLFVSGLIIVLATFFLSLMPFPDANSEVVHPKTGLRFTVQGLDNIGIGKVKGGIGLKAWLNDNTAVRGSFGFGISDTTYEPNNKDYTDEEWKWSEISFGGGIEFHPLPGKRVSPYLGFGISFSSSTWKLEPSIPKHNPSPYLLKLEKVSLSGFGAGAFVGMEFFMGNHLSLTGEYEIGFSSATGKDKWEYVDGDSEQFKATAKEIKVQTTSLILTLYF